MSIVSTVIVTCNRRDFLLQTLHSVFNQTFRDIEIIVVDNGTNDETALALAPLIDAGKIIYLPQLQEKKLPEYGSISNKELAYARNRGLEIAKGEFIAFLDDDDAWPTGKIAREVELMLQNPDVCLVAGAWRPWDGQDATELLESDYQGEVDALPLTTVFNGCPVPVTGESLFLGCPFASVGQVLIRTEFMRVLGGWTYGFRGTEDYELWFRLRAKAPFVLDSHLALFYRIHPNNMAKNYHMMLRNCHRVAKLHLTRIPRTQRRRAYTYMYRGLYRYLGHVLTKSFRLNVKRLNLKRSLMDLRAISIFFRPSLSDSQLRRRLWHELLPARVTASNPQGNTFTND